ncbi:hypothetical protein [Nisaea sp.]|uniref:hypothetical protein n=1 Tax=Nisaea sp. TaxID=2024842 RepID=UPI0032638B59
MSDAVKRHGLNATPVDIMKLLPDMDRVQTGARADGAVHERLGKIEKVEVTDTFVRISGACHDLVLDPSDLVSVEYDTSMEMRDKIYPRLDMMGKDGDVLFSFTGLEGLEAMEPHLAKFSRTPVAPRARPTQEEAEPDLENDPARPFLESLIGAAPVTVRIETPVFIQKWTGAVAKMLPAGGCFNIILKDFHLHLPANSLSGWEERGGWHHGILLDGSNSALSIGPAQ